MDLKLDRSSLIKAKSKLSITGSKSESNRLLLLQALYPQLQIKNLSNSDDSMLMQKALSSKDEVVDIHHAGTAMRFLTAYFAIQKDREVLLTGSQRMTERPIKILVDALRMLGADISYLKSEGYPPLKIKGKHLTGGTVSLKANVSSQYISALMLIGSKLEDGLKLHLQGEVTSVPYIKMTQSLLSQIGIASNFENNIITINPAVQDIHPKVLTVESDWSSASYFYSIIALSDIGTQIELSSYSKHSLQGDSAISHIYELFGVRTRFTNTNSMVLEKIHTSYKPVFLDLKNTPDIAQTIAVTCIGLGLSCQLQGLHTLKIKETDRLLALKTELEKLGGKVSISLDSLQLKACKQIKKDIKIATYNDHRMAMAFAPLALRFPLEIQEAEVVSKSYPQFWEDLKTLDFMVNKQ